MAFTHALSTNNYGPAKFIVSSTAANGTHTTIAGALADAVSGETIFIRTGTYTENITLKAGVNLCSYTCEGAFSLGAANTGNVIINGKCTFTTAGLVSISGVTLQTNSDFCLAVTGSAASVINLANCNINALNNTAISFTSSSPSSGININYCGGDLATTGVSLYSSSSLGPINVQWTNIENSGASSTASTSTGGGQILLFGCLFKFPISFTSSSGAISYSQINTGGTNSTSITTVTSGNINIVSSLFQSGSGSAISVGAGTTITLQESTINSSNTNAITGLGSIAYGLVSFGTSGTVNTSTQTSNPISLDATAKIDSSGRYTNSAQPAFLAVLGTNDSNVTGNGATYTLGSGNALTEIFDQGNDFVTTGTFTAPVTGKCCLSSNFVMADITAAMTFQGMNITTSNRTYQFGFQNDAAVATLAVVPGVISSGGSVLADMDAGDTFTTSIAISGGAGNTADTLVSGARVFMCGYLTELPSIHRDRICASSISG